MYCEITQKDEEILTPRLFYVYKAHIVKLSLPILPKAKLRYPQDNFTYRVNFTCPKGKLSCLPNHLKYFCLFSIAKYKSIPSTPAEITSPINTVIA